LPHMSQIVFFPVRIIVILRRWILKWFDKPSVLRNPSFVKNVKEDLVRCRQ
jgi:hypothetical protein